jgi:hypothetical protein
MSQIIPSNSNHPMGEIENELDKILNSDRSLCDTPGGTIHVVWDASQPVTPIGQLSYFIDFLKTANLYDHWIEECPLQRTSPNAGTNRDVLGTIFLSILSGQNRYAHITAVRNDDVNPEILGMKRVMSCDTARRAFKDIDRDSEQYKYHEWLKTHLRKCYLPMLTEPWILDMDTTVKPLYGNQEGAEVSYNPQKPGRPSQVVHTYAIGKTRVVLDGELLPGKQSSPKYTLPVLWSLLDAIPKENWPTLVRGDCIFGNENVLSAMEEKKLQFLFKVRKTTGVKQLIDFCMLQENKWEGAGQGWEGIKGELLLTGWTKKRKVVILRRPVKKRRGRRKKNASEQLLLPFMKSVTKGLEYEYSVLITSLDFDIVTIAQLYRDRGDSENIFDELKNQWGWAGYCTQDIFRGQVMTRITALIYNWWSLFVQLADSDSDQRREAITSRPLLLYAIGRMTKHAGQIIVTVTPSHGMHEQARRMQARVMAVLNWIKQGAQQLNIEARWHLILSIIYNKILKGRLLGSTIKMA